MRTPKIPRGARRLRTYAELTGYLHDFIEGLYLFLWVVGRPGVSKTETIRAAMRDTPTYYRKAGQLTPAQFYIDCYLHRGQPIILDDAEHLLDNKLGAKLISALGDTTPVKQLSYATTSSVLGDVPQVFLTTSRLCILANKVTTLVDVQSRAVILSFEPTNLEIHTAAASWFWDQEIHDWFGQHLHRLPPLDARWYVIADHDKRAGRDWRQIILTSHTLSQAETVVQDLEVDVAYPTREDKATRFVELMANAKGASRATYFRLRKRLGEEGRLTFCAVDPLLLCNTCPPATPGELELEAMGSPPSHNGEEESRAVVVSAR